MKHNKPTFLSLCFFLSHQKYRMRSANAISWVYPTKQNWKLSPAWKVRCVMALIVCRVSDKGNICPMLKQNFCCIISTLYDMDGIKLKRSSAVQDFKHTNCIADQVLDSAWNWIKYNVKLFIMWFKNHHLHVSVLFCFCFLFSVGFFLGGGGEGRLAFALFFFFFF